MPLSKKARRSDRLSWHPSDHEQLLKRAAFLVLIVVALGAATIAGACTLPWLPLAERQHEPACTVSGGRGGFIAGSLERTSQFARFMAPADRIKLRRVDYRKFAVVAIFRCFPEGGHTIELQRIVRMNHVLRLTVGIHNPPPDAGVTQLVEQAYQIVAVRKTRLGAPLPRRVTVVERAAEEDALQ